MIKIIITSKKVKVYREDKLVATCVIPPRENYTYGLDLEAEILHDLMEQLKQQQIKFNEFSLFKAFINAERI